MSGTTTPIADLSTMAPPALRFRTARGLAKGWWLFLLRGVVAVLFGLYAVLAPGLGLAVILGVLGAYLALDGALSLWGAITGRPAAPGAPNRSRVWLALEGALSLLAAFFVFVQPLTSAVALVVVVGALVLAGGVTRVVLAIRAGSWLLGLSGLLGILLGLWFILAPGPGLLALVWVVAAQAIVAGFLLIGLALRLRRINNDPTPG